MFKKVKDVLAKVFTDVHTIILARIQMLGGFLMGAVAYMDLSPLLHMTGLSSKQVMVAAGIVFAMGAVQEVARRYKATDVK